MIWPKGGLREQAGCLTFLLWADRASKFSSTQLFNKNGIDHTFFGMYIRIRYVGQGPIDLLANSLNPKGHVAPMIFLFSDFFPVDCNPHCVSFYIPIHKYYENILCLLIKFSFCSL
jgi:hypothetical protein